MNLRAIYASFSKLPDTWKARLGPSPRLWSTGRAGWAGLALLLVLPAALAQTNDRLATVNVMLDGTSNGLNYILKTSNGSELVDEYNFPTYMTKSFSALEPLKVSDIHYIEIDLPGSAPDWGSFDMTIKAPPGYTVYVDTDGDTLPDTELKELSGSKTLGLGGSNRFYYQVVDNRSLGAVVAGQMTRLDVGDLVFELGLGSMSNGKSAGRLQLRHNGKTGASTYGLPSSVFTHDSLGFVGPMTNGLAWSGITNGRMLETGQVKVEVTNDGTDKFKVLFYAGDGSTGYETTEFAEYVLEKATTGFPAHAPSNVDCLKITETQDGMSPIVHWVFRSTTGDTWTLIQGTSTEERIEEHASAAVSGNREETITVKNSGLATVTKRRLTWSPLSNGEVLTKDEAWSNPAGSPDLTTEHEYYGTGGGVDKGDRGLLKKTTYPNGAEIEYDYYDEDDRLGQIETVTEPWSNGSSTYAKVTTYDYDGPTGLFKNYLKSEIVTIDTATVAKTTHSYSFGSTDYTRTTQSYYDASNSLTTITKAYRSDAAYFDSGRPLKIEYPDGRQQSFAYEEGSNGASTTWIVEGSHTGGSTTDSESIDGSTVDFESIKLVANKSTVTQIVRNQDDNIISEKVFVWNGSAFDGTPVVNTSTTWLDGVRPDYRTAVNGAVEDWGWNGAYLASMADTAGIQHTYTYDSAGRLATDTKTAVSPSGYAAQGAIVTTYTYHATNQVKSAAEAGGSLSRLTTYDYDGAGRPTGSTLPDDRSMSAAYAYTGSAPKTSVVTETLSCGGTVTTHTLPGGNVFKVLSSGVDRYYHYSLNGSGELTTEVRYGTDSQTRYEQVVTDWLGRPKTRTRPGPPSQSNVVETFIYHATTGLLTKTEFSNGLAPEYRAYDDMGRLVCTGLDVDATAGLAEDSASDRITDIITQFTKIGSDWWTSTERKIYATASSGTATSLGTTRRQLSGLSDAGAKVEQVDRFGQVASTVTTVNTTDRKITATTTFPGTSNTAQRITINGNVVYELSPDGRNVVYTYDGLGRREEADDSRNGTTTYTYDEVYANGVYNDTDRLYAVTDPNSVNLAIYGYDAGGRVNVLQTPAGTYRYSYDCAGRLEAQWGAAQPAAFHYNDYGERDGMRTFRSGDYSSTAPTYAGGDLTTWSYHADSGLLQFKKDSANNQVDYTYNARGLVATRQWARVNGSSQRVTTTYGYADKLTELTSKTYSNDDNLTPDVTLAYTRAGLPYQGGDSSIGSSTFAYSSQLELQTETLPATFYGSRVLKRQYDGYHRPAGFKLGTSGDDDADLTQTHAFDGTTGLLQTIATRQAALTARTFTYGYVSGTSLLDTLSTGSGGTLFEVARTYETISSATKRDLVASIEATYGGGAAITRHDYTYNNARQRVSAKQSGSAFADYGDPTFYRYTYNSRGELTLAAGYLGSDVETYSSGNALPGRYHEFGYDNQGNRTEANSTGEPGLESVHPVNGLNQITARENYYQLVSGTVDSAAKVVVNGELADQEGNYWSGVVQFDNESGPATGGISIKAAKPSPETKETASATGLIAGEEETLGYDADGNLTTDGFWDYVYDAENRLVRMTSNLPSSGDFAGYDRLELEFAYDYLGRRIRKEVTNLRTSTTVSIRRYLYDGWNLVAEFAESSGSIGDLERSYTWGLDVAGSLTATGNVGALVQLSVHTGPSTVTDFYPTYDANGNVTALVKSNGTLAAVYEYGPFGELLRAQELDALVEDNPFRFSTKFTDVETGLVYYGYRYYSPKMGRFINRDPIEEQGGINLYAFTGNDPVNGVDVLGLSDVVVLPPFVVKGDKPPSYAPPSYNNGVDIEGDGPYAWRGGSPPADTVFDDTNDKEDKTAREQKLNDCYTAAQQKYLTDSKRLNDIGLSRLESLFGSIAAQRSAARWAAAEAGARLVRDVSFTVAGSYFLGTAASAQWASAAAAGRNLYGAARSWQQVNAIAAEVASLQRTANIVNGTTGLIYGSAYSVLNAENASNGWTDVSAGLADYLAANKAGQFGFLAGITKTTIDYIENSGLSSDQVGNVFKNIQDSITRTQQVIDSNYQSALSECDKKYK